jgi:hypothetical protein
MTPDELYESSTTLILATREKYRLNEAAYDRTIIVLASAMRGTDLAATWRAAVLASQAEDALVGSSDVVGAVYNQLGIPDCYEPTEPVKPGEPCAAYHRCDDCCVNCPLHKTTP